MNYLYHLATLACLYALLAQSFNLYLGFTGILALSHIAFYAIGAYTSAILVISDLPFPLAFLAAGLLPAILGCLLGLTSIRLKADYLGIATLGFAQIVLSVIQNWNSLTNGGLGIASIPKPVWLGLEFNEKWEYFLFTLVLSLILMAFLYRIVKSPFGRLLETIRDDEVAAMSLGKNTVKVKLIAFSVGAMVAGFAGSLYAHFITFINPWSFVLEELALILVITVIGGLGTFRGPFLGVLVIMLLSEPLRFLDIPAQYLGPLRLLLYSLFFLLTLLYFPQGVGGFWKTGRRRARSLTTY